MIDVDYDIEVEPIINIIEVIPYWVWGITLTGSKSIVFTANKKSPISKKYCKLVFTAKCSLTDKEHSIKNPLLPSVGDICNDNDGNRIKIIQID